MIRPVGASISRCGAVSSGVRAMTSQFFEPLERRAMLAAVAGTIWSGQYSTTMPNPGGNGATPVGDSGGGRSKSTTASGPLYEINGTANDDVIVLRVTDASGKFTVTVNGKRRSN